MSEGAGTTDEATNGGSRVISAIPSSEQTRPEPPKCIHEILLTKDCEECDNICNGGRT